MLSLDGISLPITLDCNLHCKYCFRDKCDIHKLPDFTPEMIEYIKSRSPKNCFIFTITGGEPLLHFNKVKEIFALVNKDIHKKIITNGTLLTQDIVDYVNENQIELQISHDGAKTKFLREVDILDSKVLRNLIFQVKTLSISSVITKYNTNIWENFFNTSTRLGRRDFKYKIGLLVDAPFKLDLLEGFDYKEWFVTMMEFSCSKFNLGQHDNKNVSTSGFDILPDGNICSCMDVSAKYGSIYTENVKELHKNMALHGDTKYCIESKCNHFGSCFFNPYGASEHLCKCRRMIMDFRKDFRNIQNLRMYVNEHLDEIEKKYCK